MRFLSSTFGVTIGILVAALYWWRPAPFLISITPMDWAEAYETAHIPETPPLHAMTMGSRQIRRKAAHLPLTDFIRLETQDRLRRSDSAAWRQWAAGHGGERPGSQPSGFLLPGNPLSEDLSPPGGYLEIYGRDRIDLLRYHWLNAAELAGKGIPSGLRYPYRAGALLILITTLILAASAWLRPAMDCRVPACTAGKGSKVFAVIMCTGAALITLPFLYQLRYHPEVFVALGGFIVLFGFLGLTMFGSQAVLVSNLLRGKKVLARWSCAPDEWRRFTTWAYATEKVKKRGPLWALTVVLLSAGGGFWLLLRDETSLLVLLVLSGIVAISWLIVLMHRWLSCRWDSRHPGEVVIGPSGLYLNGAVHSWSAPGSRLESVQYGADPLPMLEITYSYFMKAGHLLYLFRKRETVHVPVPKDRLGDAVALAKTLMKRKGR